MLNPTLKTVLYTIGQVLPRERTLSGSDETLLDRFFNDQDSYAFELLLRRHGSMVLGVCRRILADAPDVDDAFQATFLILLQKGRGFAARSKLSTWLHTVAYHVALRSRANRSRRRELERQVMREKQTCTIRESDDDPEWRAVLDEELYRLPEKYRSPLILCYLEGLSQEAAAHDLGWPTGTVSSRMARAREQLRQRLSRRGVVLPTALLGALGFAEMALPSPLAASTCQMATAFAAGNLATNGLPFSVLSLAEGVTHTMYMTKLKFAAVFVTVALTLTGSGVASYFGLADQPASPSKATPKKPAEKGPKSHHLAHPGDPVKLEEHAALFDLVDDCQATHTAVADGAWGDPKTWDTKTVPGDQARVVIPKGRRVTVAGLHDRARVDWVRVDGTLRFDPKTNTSLKVVTLVGNVQSSIEIGTEKEPVRADKTARLILGDRGERNGAERAARSLRPERWPARPWPGADVRGRVHQPRHAHGRAA